MGFTATNTSNFLIHSHPSFPLPCFTSPHNITRWTNFSLNTQAFQIFFSAFSSRKKFFRGCFLQYIFLLLVKSFFHLYIWHILFPYVKYTLKHNKRCGLVFFTIKGVRPTIYLIIGKLNDFNVGTSKRLIEKTRSLYSLSCPENLTLFVVLT